MKLQNMTQKLIDEHGFSQDSLARELTGRGSKCSQPTVGRILKGANPSFSLGDAIRQLYSEKMASVAAA